MTRQSCFNFQLYCRKKEDPTDNDPLYATDILNKISIHLQEGYIIKKAFDLGLGYFIPDDVINPKQVNQYGQFEDYPLLVIKTSFIEAAERINEKIRLIEGETFPI